MFAWVAERFANDVRFARKILDGADDQWHFERADMIQKLDPASEAAPVVPAVDHVGKTESAVEATVVASGEGTNTESLSRRFWKSVNKEGPQHPILGTKCWMWTVHSRGGKKRYGCIRAKRGVKTVQVGAHVASWFLHHGEWPDDLMVMHRCDNGLCVNPDHLLLGTCQDNVSDMVAKGRNVVGEKHPYHKISESDALDILKLSKSGLSTREIAKSKGVTRGIVQSITRGLTWTAVTGLSRTKPQSIAHGTTSGYQYSGCRCQKCRSANAKRSRDWNRRKSALKKMLRAALCPREVGA